MFSDDQNDFIAKSRIISRFHIIPFFFVKILRIDFDMFNHLINMNLNINFYIATLFYYITLSSFFKL